jgi:hypothetical protein
MQFYARPAAGPDRGVSLRKKQSLASEKKNYNALRATHAHTTPTWEAILGIILVVTSSRRAARRAASSTRHMLHPGSQARLA